MEIQSDAVAVVREFLAVDDFSADGGFIFQGSELYYLTGLPRAIRDYAGTVNADVIGVSNF